MVGQIQILTSHINLSSEHFRCKVVLMNTNNT